jgi:hypothetical protein
MPISIEAFLFCEVARIAVPVLVLVRKTCNTMIARTERKNEKIRMRLVEKKKRFIFWLRKGSISIFGLEPNMTWAVFAIKMLRPIESMRTSMSAFLSIIGLNSHLSARKPMIPTPIAAMNMAEIQPTQPVRQRVVYMAKYEPSMRKSPWAKFDIFMTPKIMVRPTAIRQ